MVYEVSSVLWSRDMSISVVATVGLSYIILLGIYSLDIDIEQFENKFSVILQLS